MSYKILGFATQIMVMAIIISLILLCVGIGVLVLIHVCIVGRAFRRGFGNGTMVDRGSTGSISMSQEDIEKLPCFDFKARDEKGSSPGVDCAVCLENFKMGEKCRLLPICRHSFHAQCVDSWLLKTPICPICRTSADSRKDRSNSGEESSHFSDYYGSELREGSQVETSSNLSAITNEQRESQVTESAHIIESSENCTSSLGNQLSPNPVVPLQDSLAGSAV